MKGLKKIHKIVAYILNSIMGATFLFSLCMVEAYSWKAYALLIFSGLWLVGAGLIHDWKIEREKGGAKRVRSR